MGTCLQFAATLETITCCVCGIEFAMPQWYIAARRDDHKLFCCPNEHTQSFKGETEAQRLQKELDRANRSRDYEKTRREQAEKRAEHAKRSAASYRGKLKHVKERIGNGICPCCRRTFVNLQRHMASKHPTFKGEDLP